MSPIREGQVKYTARAFEQDAVQAIRGDVVRALIELVTNADDAYGAAEGEIRIEVERPAGATDETRITVRDRARGLDAAGLEESFAVLGARRSGFEEGKAVRGNLGRGAKDTAVFGQTIFEAILDDQYSRLELDRDGSWRLTNEDEPATPEHRERLGLGPKDNGLTSTMVISAGKRVDKVGKLGTRLSNTAQLRLLTAARNTILVDQPAKGAPYTRPVKYEPPAGDVVIDEDVDVPGCPGVKAHLRVEQMKERIDGSPGPETHHGLLVNGARAVYENTLFALHNRPHAGWFRGVLRCEHIDALVRDYDDRFARRDDPTEDNPVRIIDRGRDGLVREHPFTVALGTLVARKVGPLIEEAERKEADNRREGEGLRRDLRDLSRDLAAMLRAELAELEDEHGGSGGAETDLKPLTVIPPVVVIAPESDKTLTVLIRDDLVDAGAELTVRCDDTTVVTIAAPPDERVAHARYPGVSTSRLVVRSVALGSAKVTIEADGHSTQAEVVVTDEITDPVDPPEFLTFSRDRYSVTRGKGRTIEVWAPLNLVTSSGTEVAITMDGHGVDLGATSLTLSLDKRGWFVARLPLKAVAAGGKASIAATLGGEEAAASVRVVEPSDPAALGLEVEVRPLSGVVARAAVEDSAEGLLLKVFGKNPALAPLLGKYVDGKGYERESHRDVRLVLAEIISDELSKWLIEREAGRYPERFPDASSVIVAHRRRVAKFLPRAQRLLEPGDG